MRSVLSATCVLSGLRNGGNEYNIPENGRFTDYRDLFYLDLDIVCVVIPDQLHVPVSIDFLKAGINVLCEKPLALHRDELVRMCKAEKESKACFMVGHICRFAPAFNKAKEMIDDGTLGEILPRGV